MIIKGIELNNIRSHVNSFIDLNKGITVFSGRTGSGKSTFMMSIAYALFGSDANISNESLLRRGSKNGFARIVFSNNNHDYEIMRGVKRVGSNILVDADKLWIREDGVKLNIIARTKEFNEKILELLRYPDDVKPRELFEITSYAKQDEIRKLIELSSGEREKHIDRVLQLSKYELTYENMRLLINKLGNELSLVKGRISGLSNANDDLKIKSNEAKELADSLKLTNDELALNESNLSKVKVVYDLLKKEISELEFKKSQFDNRSGLLRGVTDEINLLQKELSECPAGLVDDFDELISKQSLLMGKASSFRIRIDELVNEISKINSLPVNCPLCRQAVSHEHVSSVSKAFNDELVAAKLSLNELSKELVTVKEALTKSRSRRELITSISVKTRRLNELVEKRDYLVNGLKELEQAVSDLCLIKDKFVNVSDEYLLLSGTNRVLIERKNSLSSGIIRINSDLSRLKEAVVILESSKKLEKRIGERLRLFNNLREDIRSIRGVVRTRFLEDFRHEFQRKYEDVRQDDGYSVDIGLNYEPVAYAGSDSVSIDSLSGGEKTGVALAYRLALSEIAAKVSSIDHSELLILDEPTTGFDRKDIAVLPEALKVIRIPQILIVTHEDELKEAADVKYELNKESGITKIN